MSKIMGPIEWLATKGINVESGIVKDAISAERLKQYAEYYHAERAKNMYTESEMRQCYKDAVTNVGESFYYQRKFITDDEYILKLKQSK